MKQFLLVAAAFITHIIHLFYPPFKRICTPQTFRYAVCGGGNLVLDWTLYFFVYNCLLEHQMVRIGFVTISSHIASLIIVFPITILTGFFLSKYVTFVHAIKANTIHQLLKYIATVALNLLINYAGLKLLVEVVGFYPTPSKMAITLCTVLFSYLIQRYYTFRSSDDK